MAPSAVREVESEQTFAVKSPRSNARYLMDRNLKKDYPVVVRANGNYIYFQDGRQILDSTSGAAVSCLGHRNKRVKKAMDDLEETGVAYLASNFYSHPVVNELAEEIIRGTDYKMARVYLTGSGSEAMEATIKLSRQFFWMDEKSRSRVNFIARETSYHGNTIGALGISGHKARRAPYEQFLMDNVYHVSACNPYRQRKNGQSDAEFVAAKADELDAKFRELGPETVIGFIMEPVVGAALGCVPYVPGYMKAMKEVCHKHGALFILDEVMCGMGRTGTLHAWQAENVVPDIQTVGKGLGGGFQPIAAVIISHKVVDALMNNTCEFIHGQTYQGMPIQAAAALEVQRIVREDKLMKNVQVQGLHLAKLLKSLLGDHPNVGDIRGMGLFWGIEFVKNKEEKTPFESAERIAQKVHATAMADPYNIALYPCTGCADGWSGDDIIIAPAYNISKEEVEIIANRTAEVIRKVFADFGSV